MHVWISINVVIVFKKKKIYCSENGNSKLYLRTKPSVKKQQPIDDGKSTTQDI